MFAKGCLSHKIYVIVVCLLLVFSGFGCSSQTEKDDQYINDLKSPNIVVSSNAIKYIAKNQVVKAVPCLIECLEVQQNKTTALLAIDALGDIKDTRAVSPLIKRLDDPDMEIRLTVIGALGKIKSPAAVPKLIVMLQNEQLQQTAIWALGQIRDKTAIAPLTELLADPNKYVRFNASQALKSISKAK